MPEPNRIRVVPKDRSEDVQAFEIDEEETRLVSRRVTIEELLQERQELQGRVAEIDETIAILNQKLKEVLEVSESGGV